MKSSLPRKILTTRVPRPVLLLLLLAVIGWVLHPFFLPALQSHFEWAFHPTITFEKQSMSVPMGWSKDDAWHLLSLRKPHFFAHGLSESTIVIDPFAERHPGSAEKYWEKWSHIRGKTVTTIPGARCIQSNIHLDMIEIDCLSPDATVMFEFTGDNGDLRAFRDVYRQATAIAAMHPGQIVR